MSILQIGNALECNINQDFKKKDASCDITRKGKVVANVLLNPVRLSPGHSLSYADADMVCSFVSRNHKMLEEEYFAERKKASSF